MTPQTRKGPDKRSSVGGSTTSGGTPTPEDASLISAHTLIEHPVYFVSTVLQDARARYPMPQKLLLVLLVASRKLRHYF